MRLNEVMGATTWMYPASEVTLEELMQILRALRQGFREAYSAYVDKAKSFSAPPAIGERWPREGYYLPAVEVFLAEAAKRASHETLAAIHAALEPSAKPESEAGG
jgi:adenylate cyclase